MDHFQFDEISELELPRVATKTRSNHLNENGEKLRRFNDRRQFEKELREMNLGLWF